MSLAVKSDIVYLEQDRVQVLEAHVEEARKRMLQMELLKQVNLLKLVILHRRTETGQSTREVLEKRVNLLQSYWNNAEFRRKQYFLDILEDALATTLHSGISLLKY
jgi:hypothetical protein